MRKTIGDIIVELGFIEEDSRKSPVDPGGSHEMANKVGMLLLEKTLIRSAGPSRAFALGKGRSFLKLGRNKIEQEFMESVSPDILKRFNYISIEKDGNHILIAVDPADAPPVSEIEDILSCLVSQIIFTPREISSLFGRKDDIDAGANGYVQFSADVEPQQRLGDVLVQHGFVTRETVEGVARSQNDDIGKKLGVLLREQGHLTYSQLAQALAIQKKLPFVRLTRYRIAPEFLTSITHEMMTQYSFVPLERDGSRLLVAIADPTDKEQLVELEQVLDDTLDYVVASPAEISKAILMSTVIDSQRPPEDEGKGADLADATSIEEAKPEDASAMSVEETPGYSGEPRRKLGDIIVEKGFAERGVVEDAASVQAAGVQKRLGELLLSWQQVTPAQLERALADQASPVTAPAGEEEACEGAGVVEDPPGGLIGDILVNMGFVEPEQVESAVSAQAAGVDKKLGQLLLEENQVTPGQLKRALAVQAASPKPAESGETAPPRRPIGDILVDKGLVGREVVESAVSVQAGGVEKKLGQLLLEGNHVTPAQLKRALAEQVAPKPPPADEDAAAPRRPIGDVLVDMGLVERGMVEKAASLQAGGAGKPLGELLVEWNHVTPGQLGRALTEQTATDKPLVDDEAAPPRSIGDILVKKAFVERVVVEKAASAQADGVDKKLGQLLLDGNHVTPAQLEWALAEQAAAEKRWLDNKAAAPRQIGDILVEKGFVEREVVESAVSLQASGVDKRLGQLLREWNHVTPRQLERALTEQSAHKEAVSKEPVTEGATDVERVSLKEKLARDLAAIEEILQEERAVLQQSFNEKLAAAGHKMEEAAGRASLETQTYAGATGVERASSREKLARDLAAIEEILQEERAVLQQSFNEKLAAARYKVGEAAEFARRSAQEKAVLEKQLAEAREYMAQATGTGAEQIAAERAALEQNFNEELAAARHKVEEAAELARRSAQEQAVLEKQLAEAREAGATAAGAGAEQIAAERAALEAQASARLASAEERLLSERKAYEERLTAGQEMLRQMMDANAVLEKRLAQAKTAFTSRLTFEMNDMEEMIETSNNLKRQLTKVLD